MFKKWGHLLIILILGCVLTGLAITPPLPKGLDTPADQFSSARAMIDVRVIASKPHPTGSEENANVRSYLENRLKKLGMDVRIDETTLEAKALKRLNKWSGDSKTEQAIFNVIGVMPSADRKKPALLLMAHHDTVWGSPGAADDTIGIASILEIARAVQERGGLERDLIVLFTDGEEVGLAGARHFFKNHPLKDKIGAVINFEARGGGGTANMFQTSAKNGEAAKIYAHAVKQPSLSSLSTFVYNLLPNDTDLTPALEQDYIAYNIANIGRAEYYHSPKIDIEALDIGTLQHMGSQGLDLSYALLTQSALPAQTHDNTFFDAFGIVTILYNPAWGWIFLVLTALFYSLSIMNKVQPKEVTYGILKMAGFLIIGSLALYGMNVLSGAGQAANYYDRLAAIPKLEGLAFVTCLTTFLAFFALNKLNPDQRLGAMLPIFIIGIIGQTFAPTATYFITLPLLFCAAATTLFVQTHRNVPAHIIALTLSTIIIGYMLSLSHLLMLGIGPDLLSVAILPAAIATLAILPVYPKVSKPITTGAILFGIFISLGIALWIRLDPIAATIAVY